MCPRILKLTVSLQLALIGFKQQKNMLKCNRMLEAGEAPLYVAIRITRFTSEDVGLAAPYALEIAVCRLRVLHPTQSVPK